MKEVIEASDYGTIDLDIYRHEPKWNVEAPPVDRDENIIMTAICRVPILNFDLGGYPGKKINHAALYLQADGNEYPLEVEITSISHPWDGRHATLVYADKGVKWVHHHWFTDVVMGNGNSMHFSAETKYDEKTGTIKIDLPVMLVYAMIYGQSYGLGLIDNKSEQYTEAGDLVFKKFNVNKEKGPVPKLEIDYCDDQCCCQEAGCAADFKAVARENNDSFEYAGVELNWTVPEQYCKGFTYCNLYISERNVSINSMEKVQKYFVPDIGPGKGQLRTGMEYLKPFTSYRFAVTVCCNSTESEPVYTEITTLGVPQRPVIVDIPGGDESVEGVGAYTDSFSVYVLDEISKANPINGNIYELDPEGYASDTAGNLKHYKNDRFDGKMVYLTGTAGEKLAFQFLIENRINGSGNYTVEIHNNNLPKDAVALNKVWYIKCENAWYPEAAIPMGIDPAMEIPYRENKIPGQRFQSIFVDIDIPEKIKGGVYRFLVELRSGSSILDIPAEVKVEDVILKKADFGFELNGYVPVPMYMGYNYGDEEYDSIEEAYYKTAFRHDCEINILPYTQYGKVQPGFAPKIEFTGEMPAVVDWSEWDAHFGKYFDGSYLLDTIGRKIPVKQMYLPFHENWPMPLDRYFKVKVNSTEYPQMVNEYALKSGHIENDFLPAYRAGIKNILKEFIRHIDEKGWSHVGFQFYTNNKHYYKIKDYMIKQGQTRETAFSGYEVIGNEGNATSWWILEECVFPGDFKATAYFAEILREAQKETGSGCNIKYRTDVSRYHHMFDYLDNKLDIAVMGLRMLNYRLDQARKRKREFGEEYWFYGGLNGINESNISLCCWIADTYVNGAGRILPWNCYGQDYDYDHPSKIAGLYPGNRFGLKQPIVSLRIKAVRRGMQLLNYLQTFKDAYCLNDIQLKAYVEAFMRLKADDRIQYVNDAGYAKYKGNTDLNLERLKKYILKKLKASGGRSNVRCKED